MHPLLELLLLVTSIFIASSCGQFLVARLMGLKIYSVHLFVGPSLLKLHCGGTYCYLRTFPVGSSICLTPSLDEFEAADQEQFVGEFYSAERKLNEMHPLLRSTLYMSSTLWPLAITLACLGIDRGGSEILSGFSEIIRGILAHKREGERLLSNWDTLCRSSPITLTVGIVASKLTALSLMPFPTFPMFEATRAVLRWKKYEPTPKEDILPTNDAGIGSSRPARQWESFALLFAIGFHLVWIITIIIHYWP